jgi:hypothetical protein
MAVYLWVDPKVKWFHKDFALGYGDAVEFTGDHIF